MRVVFYDPDASWAGGLVLWGLIALVESPYIEPRIVMQEKRGKGQALASVQMVLKCKMPLQSHTRSREGGGGGRRGRRGEEKSETQEVEIR